MISPEMMRNQLITLINHEMKNARHKKAAAIILKLNSLSDDTLIRKLYEAAIAGVEIKMVVRGICCMFTENKKFKKPVYAVSIVDEYLEHARVIVFHNDGKKLVYISSADWMVRNLDHRVEAAVQIKSPEIAAELIDILQIQLKDNVKARVLDNFLTNTYIKTKGKRIRSQIDIYNYLQNKSASQDIKNQVKK